MFSIYQDTFVAAFVAYVVALVCIEYNLPIRRPSDSKWALIIIISFLMVAIYGLQWNHLQALPSASWERWVETLFLSCIFLGLGAWFYTMLSSHMDTRSREERETAFWHLILPVHLGVALWPFVMLGSSKGCTLKEASGAFLLFMVISGATRQWHPENVSCIHAAAEKGDLAALKKLTTQGLVFNEITCAQAAKSGSLSCLKWLRENGCAWDERTCNAAAFNGHLNVLKWARENQCPWGQNTCGAAAESGSLSILKWVRRNQCRWDESTCAAAAGSGNLGVLKWARNTGCPWDERTTAMASAEGHLHALEWARDNGCPWDYHVCLKKANQGRHKRVARWIRTNQY